MTHAYIHIYYILYLLYFYLSDQCISIGQRSGYSNRHWDQGQDPDEKKSNLARSRGGNDTGDEKR